MPTAETQPFWQGLREHRLRLPMCGSCRQILYPPPPRCPQCLSDALSWIDLTGQGRLKSWTVIHLDLSSGIEPPFVIGEVELVEQSGLVLVALVVGTAPQDLMSNADVQMTFDDAAGGTTYPQFELVHSRP